MRWSLMGFAFLVAGCPAHDDGGGAPDLAVASSDDMATSSPGPHDLATPTAPNGGTMEVISTPASWSGAASFYTGTVPTMSPECSYTTVGACTASHCIIGTVDGGTAATYALVSAGDVAVSVGTTAPVAFAPQPGSYYVAPGSNSQPFFSGGETLTFTTSGAVAPASTTTVQAPAPPTVVTPAQAPPYALSRTSDFPFAWTGGGPGVFSVSVQTTPGSITPGTPFGAIRCSFAISDGSGVIPSAAIAVLPAGNAMVSFGVSNQTVNVVGDWALTAAAVTYPKNAAGQAIGGGQATIN